jgi:hypothetical protein
VPEPGNPQAFNRYSYARNSPLRYRDPAGFFEEDQLKEWFPDLWEYWRDHAAEFWEMLLEAEFGDLVEAHFGKYSGMFMEGEDGRPYLGDGTNLHASLDERGGLDQWRGSPRPNAAFAYKLIRTHGTAVESWQFGEFSWEQIGTYTYEYIYIYHYYNAARLLDRGRLAEADGLFPDVFDNVKWLAAPLSSVAAKVGRMLLPKGASKLLTVVPYVGWGIGATDMAVWLHNVMIDEQVFRRFWIDWSSAPYKWQ